MFTLGGDSGVSAALALQKVPNPHGFFAKFTRQKKVDIATLLSQESDSPVFLHIKAAAQGAHLGAKIISQLYKKS